MEILTNFSNPDSDTDHLVDKIVILINIMLTIIKGEEQSKPYTHVLLERVHSQYFIQHLFSMDHCLAPIKILIF